MNRFSSKKMLISKTLTTIILVVLAVQGEVSSQTIPFTSDKWEFYASEHKIGNYFGKEGIFLKDGGAIVKDSEFENGIIEFDITVTGERGFMGVIWRIQDEKNYEEFYIRPHQSGNPDANQYTPVFNGMSGWQLYYGKEYSAPVKYIFNQWMHIKLVISGQQAEVYINDMENPALFIPELKRKSVAGKVGINVTKGFAPAYFANFSYKEIGKPEIKTKPMQQKQAEAGTVMSWSVSNTFDPEWLKDKYDIKDLDMIDFHWTKLNSESTGIANLARVQGISEKHNTAFAKLVIYSDKEQVKKIKFGYSDNVKVYVKGKLIYGGTNFYMSRDYRYLGTIGLFDELYLHLEKGENQILFAVTENFGGWGILAAFDELNSIKFN
jgi:hypothetical protein